MGYHIAGTTRNHRFELCQGEASPSHIDKRARHPTHLVRQERVAFYFEVYEIEMLSHLCLKYLSHSAGIRSARQPAEAGEIMPPEEIRRRRTHSPYVQRRSDVVCGPPRQRRWGSATIDRVAIPAATRHSTRVEVTINYVSPLYYYIIGQIEIECSDKGLRRMDGAGIEGHHLALGMYPSVGSAGPFDSGLLTCKTGYSHLELRLYGGRVGLVLESMVSRSFVFHD